VGFCMGRAKRLWRHSSPCPREIRRQKGVLQLSGSRMPAHRSGQAPNRRAGGAWSPGRPRPGGVETRPEWRRARASPLRLRSGQALAGRTRRPSLHELLRLSSWQAWGTCMEGLRDKLQAPGGSLQPISMETELQPTTATEPAQQPRPPGWFELRSTIRRCPLASGRKRTRPLSAHAVRCSAGRAH
jgi:hypothetical protein